MGKIYKVQHNNSYTGHCSGFTYLSTTLVLNDGYDDSQESALEALIASGDYFITLATTLDGLSDVLEHPELEPLVQQLMYLHNHYDITKK